MATPRDYARAYRERNYARRIKVHGRWLAPLPTDQHGTPSAYHNHGCQCDPCRDAATAAARDYRQRKAQQ